MKAETKIMKQRLEALQLAEEIGNVRKVCRERGICPSQFYEFKKRYKEQAYEGLRDLPPIVKNHPFTTSPEVVKRILELAKSMPAKGCYFLSHQLKLEGINCSGPTVQKILEKNNLGTKYQRALALEEDFLDEKVDIDAEQEKAIEKQNPCFKERHVESHAPGYLLSQDTVYVGRMEGIGKVYMQSVVDTYGSYAFGYLHTGKLPDHAALVLYNDVLPFYKAKGIDVENILTDNGREYCGRTTHHHYEIFLALNNITHRRTRVATPQTNGFVERFNRSVQEEFLNIAKLKKEYKQLEELQTDLDEWLNYYNNERPHQGYRNRGRRPIETINLYLTQQKRTARKEA